MLAWFLIYGFERGIMSGELKYWSIRSTLTLAQATLLIIGESPYEWPESRLLTERPSGFKPIFDQMVNDAKDIECDGVESDELEGEYFTEYTLMTYKPEWIDKRTEDDWLSTEVSRLVIIKWAKANKLDVSFLGNDVLSESETSKISTRLEYTTDLLLILNLAINEFFNPRNSQDAKQEEVSEWIENKGKELKITVSKNVADAMFTIIKPHDHNPKIKRV
jgi:hypothetical protein